MENKIEIPPFYLNQEIIANQNAPDGEFKKGDEFKVTGIYKDCCDWMITIGLNTGQAGMGVCKKCRATIKFTSDMEDRFFAFRFSPKIEISAFISMSEVVKLETVGVN